MRKAFLLLLAGTLLSSIGIQIITREAIAKKPIVPGKNEASYSIIITGDIEASAIIKGSDKNWEPPNKLGPRIKDWMASGQAIITKFGPFNTDPDDSLACDEGQTSKPGTARLTVKHGVSSTKDIWLTTYAWSDSESEHSFQTLDRIREECEQCMGSWDDDTNTWTVACKNAEVWYTVRSGTDVSKCKLLITYDIEITKQP